MKKPGLKIFAPASVANLSVGFDVLGLALEQPGDDIIIRQGRKKGLVISKITGDGGRLPKTIDENTATYAAKMLLNHLGENDLSVEMEIHKKMPFSSGLGSSAASAVGGVMAINEFLGKPLKKVELLPFAVLGEQVADGGYHADNVAPCLFGGIVLIRDIESGDIIQLPAPPGLHVCIIHPHFDLPTKQARAILTESIEMSQHIQQSSNLGAFISSLYTSDFELMKRSLEDCIIEPQRAHMIPFFPDLKEIARHSNAIGFGISGAGPSVFALTNSSVVAETLISKMGDFLESRKIGYDSYISKVNRNGAFRY